MSGKVYFVLGLLCFAAMIASDSARGATSEAPILIVTPARPNLIKWAFDISNLRAAYIVSYRRMPGRDGLLLHMWNSRSRRWVESDVGSYRTGSQFTHPPAIGYLLGVDAEFPTELQRETPAGMQTIRVSVMDPVMFANLLNEHLRFSDGEWRWLEGKWDLSLKDLNSERRRYGRYGRPDRQTPAPQPTPPENTVLPAEPFAWETQAIEEVPVPNRTDAPPPAVFELPPIEQPAVTEPAPVRPVELPKPGPVSRRAYLSPIVSPADPAVK